MFSYYFRNFQFCLLIISEIFNFVYLLFSIFSILFTYCFRNFQFCILIIFEIFNYVFLLFSKFSILFTYYSRNFQFSNTYYFRIFQFSDAPLDLQKCQKCKRILLGDALVEHTGVTNILAMSCKLVIPTYIYFTGHTEGLHKNTQMIIDQYYHEKDVLAQATRMNQKILANHTSQPYLHLPTMSCKPVIPACINSVMQAIHTFFSQHHAACRKVDQKNENRLHLHRV